MAFSPAQHEAITHKDGPALILAGPGSGKTTVITHRVKHLIEQHNIPGYQILVITFTRAAAHEMRSRFLALSNQDSQNVSFGTFHSVFFRILRLAYQYDSSNILTPKEQFTILREIIEQLDVDYEDEQEFLSSLLGEISSVKSNLLSLEHYYSKSCPEQTFRTIFHRYTSRLHALRKIDFDDILSMTYELLSQREDICKAWQKKFRYILIDEFQDINLLQYKTIRLLAAPENNLFIVGDDDQSIYRFRGARPEIMLGFEQDYPNAKRILLNINYRSDACIVRTACRLIAHNRTRFPKEIEASHAASMPVTYRLCKDIGEQNRVLIRQILSQKEQGRTYRDMAILFRTNLGGRFLTHALMQANIPFFMKDTLPNLYEHWIALDFLAYLKLAAGSKERALWLRIINRPNRYISRDALTPFQEISIASLFSYYHDKDWMQDRLDRLAYDFSMLKKMAPTAAIHYIRKAMHYDEYLSSYASERHMNLQELYEVADSIQESTKACKNLEQFLTLIQTYTETLKEQAASQKTQTEENAVCLCTLHASKGLEFPVVFLPDVNEDNIPHSKASLDMDLEEERRLFYVGVTRAKEELYIYSVKEHLSQPKTPSRFLQEMKDPRTDSARS